MSETQSELTFTGERYVPAVTGDIALEHRHRYVFARNICQGKRVLDVACGEGYGSALLAEVAHSVVGADISKETVEFARKKYTHPGLRFVACDCSDLSLDDRDFDVVVSFETIEHHDRHQQMMKEIKRVLRPRGLLVISSPDRFRYSDSRNYSNPYHVKELYFPELQELLGGFFKNVRFYGQRMVFGSAIVGEQTSAPPETFRLVGSDVHRLDGIEPLYWIAIASDAELPPMRGGILEQPIRESEVVKDYADRIAALFDDLSDRDGQLNVLRDELQRIKSGFYYRACDALRAAAMRIRGAVR